MFRLSPKHIKSIRLNTNISKYWEFGESKVPGLDTKSDITSKYVTNYFIIIRHYKWFSEEEETSLLGKNNNKSIIIHKIQRWPQPTKPITTNKNCNNQQGRSPTVPTTATCKNAKDYQGQQLQSALHTPQIPLSP